MVLRNYEFMILSTTLDVCYFKIPTKYVQMSKSKQVVGAIKIMQGVAWSVAQSPARLQRSAEPTSFFLGPPCSKQIQKLLSLSLSSTRGHEEDAAKDGAVDFDIS